MTRAVCAWGDGPLVLKDGVYWHPNLRTVCRDYREVKESEPVTVENVVIATCDRCRLEVKQQIGDALRDDMPDLPKGWGTAVIGDQKSDLCPKCLAVALEAIRPLKRVRQGEAGE